MKRVKPVIFFLMAIALSLFGFFNPELFKEQSSLQYSVSYLSIILLFVHIHSNDWFQMYVTKYGVSDISFGLGWKNYYHFTTTALISLIVSMPLLAAKEISSFVVLFSCCYFQSLIVLAVLHVLYKPSQRKLWHIVAMCLVLMVIISDKVSYGEYLLFNPLLGLSYLPYYFNAGLTFSNVLWSGLLSYGAVLLCVPVEAHLRSRSRQ